MSLDLICWKVGKFCDKNDFTNCFSDWMSKLFWTMNSYAHFVTSYVYLVILYPENTHTSFSTLMRAYYNRCLYWPIIVYLKSVGNLYFLFQRLKTSHPTSHWILFETSRPNNLSPLINQSFLIPAEKEKWVD